MLEDELPTELHSQLYLEISMSFYFVLEIESRVSFVFCQGSTTELNLQCQPYHLAF